MIIKINSLDTLFFRDGKPYGIGEETWTGSTVLPNPSVIWGALFSMLMAHEPKKVTINDIDKLKLGRIFLYDQKRYSIYLPAPLDLFKEKKNKLKEDKTSKDVFFANLGSTQGVFSNYPLQNFVLPDTQERVEGITNTFININDLYDEYYREENKISLTHINEFNKLDYKIGIGRDKTTRSTKEGLLYRIELTEFDRDWCFLVEVCIKFNVDFPSHGLLKLGGEGKAASFEVVNEEDVEDIAELSEELENKFSKNKQGIFKLYFSSPTFFKEGWYDTVFNEKFNILAAFIGKPMSIGGFDVDKQQPKAMLKAIPQGTIYYLKNIHNLSYQEAQQEIANSLTTLNNRGFGSFELLPYKNK